MHMATGTDSGQIPQLPLTRPAGRLYYMLGQDQTAAVTYSVSGPYGRRCAATLALPILPSISPPLASSLFRLFAPPERERPSFFAASSTKEALACVSSTPAPLGKILAHSVHIRLYRINQYSF